MTPTIYKPYQQFNGTPASSKVADRKALFAGLNEFVRARSGWLTSMPGAREVTMECLYGSTLPDELRGLGYKVEADGEGQRVVPDGIVAVERFRFSLP